jgi:alginate O-acetyltransferase complex protein AlgI
MLRRFLIFTMGLAALFLGAAHAQFYLPEKYQLFPEQKHLLPSNPARSYLDALPAFSSREADPGSTKARPQEDRAAEAEGNTEPRGSSNHSWSRGERANETGEENSSASTLPDGTAAYESRPILDSGPDFEYLRAFFEALAVEENRVSDSRDREDGTEPHNTDLSDNSNPEATLHSGPLRIIHFGDSIMWGDNLTIKMKQLFQADFGDGGRGLVNVIDSPSSALKEHINKTRRGFRVYTIPFESFTMPSSPEMGFSGGSALPLSENSTTVHEAPESVQPWTRVQVILGHPERRSGAEPDADSFPVQIQSKEEPGQSTGTQRVSTTGLCGARSIRILPSRQIEASFGRNNKGQLPIIDGLFLETDSGISYSAVIKMGVHLAWMQMVPEEIFQCGIKQANPSLLIFQFGVNESASLASNYRGFTEQKYREQLDSFFARVRTALPDTSVLIVGPFERLRSGVTGPRPSRPQLIVREIQIELAERYGFAYFDAYKYLGGEGQMLEMMRRREAMIDYTHLTPSGGDRLAQGIYDALITHYLVYRGKSSQSVHYSVSRDFKDSREIYEYRPSSITERKGSPSAITFHSIDFAYFLFIVVTGAALLLRYPTLRLIFLILASYHFYASWKLWPISLMLFSTVLDYFCGRGIHNALWDNHRNSNRALAIFFLILSLAGNLGLLFFFKYFDFAASLINSALQSSGLELTVPALGLLLPVGISFYTFQTLSYTIDVYRGQLPMEKSFLRFSLYVTFFPQLVAGPIVRASEFIPDIKQGIYHFLPDVQDFNYGVFQFLGGLIKKMGADWLAYGLIDGVYQNSEMYTPAETLVVFYAYGLQIYGDFSGYTDMALGAARLLGFRLTDNFNRPYQSASISEFWRRWHISLGSWFRDYVYISLGGNRTAVYRNLFITMFLAGLWHGAGLMFVAWGLFHGSFLMIERLLKLDGGFSSRDGNATTKTTLWLRRVFTLHAVLVGWVLFRSRDLEQFTAFWSSLFSSEVMTLAGWQLVNVSWAYLAVVIVAYAYHMTPVQWRQEGMQIWDRCPLLLQIILTFALTLGLFQISVQDVQPFIYFQF